MKTALLFVAILFGVTTLLGQSSGSKSVPPGWIDGSKAPNLIPDRMAYRLVLISLMPPVSSDSTSIARQQAHINRIGLSDADKAVLAQTLVTFASAYRAWKQSRGASDQVWTIVDQSRSQLQTGLTPDGNSKFSAYVALAKTHMIVSPN